MGKFIGTIVGLWFFGFFGAIAGYFIGGFFGRGLKQNLSESYSTNAQSADVFFVTTLSLMGHMAKADGHVSEEEIAQAEALMAKMGVSDRREEAIQHFKSGISADFDMNDALSRFSQAARFRADLKRNLLTFLVEMAMADGELHSGEESLLRRVAAALNIEARSFEKMLEMLKAQHRFSGSYYSNGDAPASAADQLTEAYVAIGVDRSASDKEVKRAYRKLMSQYHPDKMIAKGVPEDMLAMTTEKTQEIQAAYDVIEKSRK